MGGGGSKQEKERRHSAPASAGNRAASNIAPGALDEMASYARVGRRNTDTAVSVAYDTFHSTELPADTKYFEVVVQGTGEEAILALGYPDIYILDTSKRVQSSFPVKYLRGYGQVNNIFSFETGRKCPGGVNTYFYRVKGQADVFQELNDIVASHNRGVGGDRYDHTVQSSMPSAGHYAAPLPKMSTRQSASSMNQDGDYNRLSRSASSQDEYTRLSRSVSADVSCSPNMAGQAVYNTLDDSNDYESFEPVHRSHSAQPVYNVLDKQPSSPPTSEAYAVLQRSPSVPSEAAGQYNVMSPADSDYQEPAESSQGMYATAQHKAH